MALSYDDWKNQWEGMTDVQRARVSQSMKDNATFQDYGKRYVQEQKGVNINPTGYQNNTQNTGSTVSNNQNGGTNNTEGTNTQPTVETPQNGGTNTEPTEGTQGDGKTYGKTEFDPEETLQEDKFGQDPGKITIYEGTGKDTGRPDYEIETEARLKEMTDNLDHYYATQPKLFSDRKTFNEFFQYNDRPSDQQRALLDSYWQKKQDENKAKSYTSGDALAADLNSGNMTQDVWNQVMEGNQKAYIEWQERMKNELELAIANFAAPFNPDTLADTLQSLVNKLGIQAGDPYDIIGGWENKMQELGAYQSLHELDSTVNQLKSVASQRQNIINRYASSAGGTQSDALVAARLNKALAPYDQQFSDLYTLYQTQHTTYQTKLGTANQYAQVMYQQAQEDQRIFNNKIKSLGFAMEVNSYRTPEQQAQLGLQVQQITNDMNLLNQAKQNDLALYNQRQKNQVELQYMYDKAEMQNAIDLDMTDLTVENEGQLRANLNNVLSQYYDKFGDIIQRPKQQVIDDILAYANEKGISVAQALKENFLDKLQSKSEYKNMLRDAYGMNPQIEKIGDTLVGITYGDDGIPQVHYLGNYGTKTSTSASGTIGGTSTDVAGSEWSGGNQVKLGEEAVDTGIPNVYGSNVKLTSTVGNMLQTAIDDLKSQGIDLKIGDSYRSYATQKAAYEKDQALPPEQRKGVAAPGKSFHELGQAFDIAQDQMNDPRVVQALLNAGFTRAAKGEKWHWSYGEGPDQFGGKSNKVAYDPSQGSMYAKFLDGYVPNGPAQEWLKQMGIDPNTVMTQAEAWKHDHQKQYITPMLDTIERLIANYNEGYAVWGSTGATGSLGLSQGFNDFISDYKYLKDNLTLTHLTELKEQGATFGALSDNELNAIGNSATALRLGGSKDKYEQQLWTIYNNFLTSAGLPTITLDELRNISGKVETSDKGLGQNVPTYLLDQQSKFTYQTGEYLDVDNLEEIWRRG